MYYSLVAYCTTPTVQTSHHQSSHEEILAVRGGVKPYYFRRSNFSPLVASREILVAKGGTMWARNGRWILLEMPDFHVAFNVLLHAVNLRHGTDGFTSPPKEGVLRIFSPEKIRRLRPGLNPPPRNLGTKGQHATSRPPKPLGVGLNFFSCKLFLENNIISTCFAPTWKRCGSYKQQLYCNRQQLYVKDKHPLLFRVQILLTFLC
jgi:hypothetical protein